MAKNSVADWDLDPSNNTDIGGINIAEGCAPSGINNGIRTMMAQAKAGFLTQASLTGAAAKETLADADRFVILDSADGGARKTSLWSVMKVAIRDALKPLSYADQTLTNEQQAQARANAGLGSIATRNITVSSSNPSGGTDGDLWIVV